MNFRCWMAKRRLESLAAGELTGRRAESVRKHLKGCSACAEEFERISSALDALRRVGDEVRWGEAASRQCWRGIRARLRSAQERRLVLRPLPLAVAAVGTILIAVGVWIAVVPENSPEGNVAENVVTLPPPETLAVVQVRERIPVMQEYSFEVMPVSYESGWGRY